MKYNLSIRELTELTERFYNMGRNKQPYEFNSSDLPQPTPSTECAMHDVVKAKRTCANCDSTDVIMFTADLDICNNCGCTQDGA